jgi:hypothetical protein
MNPVDRLLAQANPVSAPSPGEVTPAQERLLASIVAVPPRRRPAAPVRLMVVGSAVAAVALALVLVLGRGASVNDETDATTRGGIAGLGNGDVIHVVTRLYSDVYGPTRGERVDGWLEPSTGRARIVITTGGDMTVQQVVDAEDRVRTWEQRGRTEDRVAPDLAGDVRASVEDRMASLVELTKQGFRRDNATLGAPTTESGEYRGRAVTIHRIASTTDDGKPSGFYVKWFIDPDIDEIIAFERGRVSGGEDVVEHGEALETVETLAADEAPLHELDWRAPPAVRSATPTPTPAAPSATPTPARAAASATPTPAKPTRPTASPTPVPDPTFP